MWYTFFEIADFLSAVNLLIYLIIMEKLIQACKSFYNFLEKKGDFNA